MAITPRCLTQSSPVLFLKIQLSDAMAARALEFLILTAARSGEVLHATWDEIDLDSRLWSVPAARMKAGREHRVPLCERAVTILRDLLETRRSRYLFRGLRPGRPLSASAILERNASA